MVALRGDDRTVNIITDKKYYHVEVDPHKPMASPLFNSEAEALDDDLGL